MIYGNATGGFGMPKSFVLTDDSGNEMTGVVTGEQVVFTAGLSDIRAGKVAANADGIVTGTKDIPAYHTTEGHRVITPGSDCKIYIPNYEYTGLQAIVCSYNTSLDDSVAANQVAIKGNLYNVQSVDILSIISIDNTDQCINLGITNTTDNLLIIRYFSYKEIL